MKSMMEDYQLFADSLDDICRKAGEQPVKGFRKIFDPLVNVLTAFQLTLGNPGPHGHGGFLVPVCPVKDHHPLHGSPVDQEGQVI